MTTKHFNALTEGQVERLAILAEECAEVTQAVMKILRHGLHSNNNGQLPETNRQALQREVGDLLHALDRCFTSGDLNPEPVEERRKSKPEGIAPYLHHQEAS
jgi:hypothetical protein